jgi:2-polyprenyl-6-methoxyphenol hydroxylase-like FAD-dependent oxidoreductase
LPRRAIIAGAGIAGLATAIALLRAGFTIAIYEKANTLEEFGAGLQLTPNATRILDRLGVLERVLPLASKPRAVVVLRGSDNTELMRMRLDDAERRWGAAYLVIHRADLQRALLDAVRSHSGVEVTLGATVFDFANDGARISVGLGCGATRTHDEADLLIGADGLRSHVRRQLGFGAQDQAEFSGRVAYRAIVHADDADSQFMTSNVILRLGKKAHLVQYPLRSGSILNLVATIGSGSPTGGANPPDHEKGEGANHSGLEHAFSAWSREARLLTNAPVQWRAWPLYHRPPISSFSRGRVALVGDAAHPMVPFLAQGAAQAIEDAGALGRILAQVQDIPAAVSMYSRDRVPRATRVQREALKLGRIYHMSGPSAFARDVTMRLLGTRALTQRYDWLYGA